MAGFPIPIVRYCRRCTPTRLRVRGKNCDGMAMALRGNFRLTHDAAPTSSSGPEAPVPFVETLRRPAQPIEQILRISREVPLRYAVFAVLVGASYFVSANLGFALTFQPQPVSTLWLPNAILLGGLLLVPTSSW